MTPQCSDAVTVNDICCSFPSSAPAGLQAAAAAASQINQKLGTAGNPHAPMGGMGLHTGMGVAINEEWSVPDRMVGLSK